MNHIVFMYVEKDKEPSNETLYNICKPCANKFWGDDELEIIDAGGDWDECCKCGIQNVPQWYYEDSTNVPL